MEAFNDAALTALTPNGMDHTLLEAALSQIRLTSLDPARPAHDLLEDLLGGIGGCELLFAEYPDPEEEGDETPPDSTPTAQGTDTTEASGALIDTPRQHFYDLVRAEAAANHDQLL